MLDQPFTVQLFIVQLLFVMLLLQQTASDSKQHDFFCIPATMGLFGCNLVKVKVLKLLGEV